MAWCREVRTYKVRRTNSAGRDWRLIDWGFTSRSVRRYNNGGLEKGFYRHIPSYSKLFTYVPTAAFNISFRYVEHHRDFMGAEINADHQANSDFVMGESRT